MSLSEAAPLGARANLAPRRFEVHVQTPPQPPYSQVRRTWRDLERAGVDGLWTWDHFFTEWTPGDFEGWSLLAALAEATDQARVGVLVTAATFRHPGLLAKIVTTVDHVSEGRLIVGLGAARLAAEHEAFGLAFPPPGERVKLVEQTCRVLAGLGSGRLTMASDHLCFENAPGDPLPLQRPQPPILIGAHGPRLIEVTARYAQYWNCFGSLEEQVAIAKRMDATCERVGRDPASLRRLPALLPAMVKPGAAARYRDAGFDGVILIAPSNDPAATLPLVEMLQAT